MKRIITIAFFVLLSSTARAQIKFQNDTNYATTNFDIKFDSAFNIEKVNDFEFRFTIIPSSLIPGRTITLFILTQNKNLWKAKLLQRMNYVYSEKLVDSLNLSKLWQQLLQQKILSIPNNITLKDKDGEIAMSNMKDGASYHFSFVTKSAKKSYSYYSPQSAIEEYPEIKSFTQVSNIIELIKNYCNL